MALLPNNSSPRPTCILDVHGVMIEAMEWVMHVYKLCSLATFMDVEGAFNNVHSLPVNKRNVSTYYEVCY